MGKGGGMALGKAVGAKALDLLEHPLGERRVIAAPDHAADQLFAVLPQALSVLEGRVARRSRSASSGVKLAATMATRIACSWNSGTPRVRSSTERSSSGRPCAGEGAG